MTRRRSHTHTDIHIALSNTKSEGLASQTGDEPKLYIESNNPEADSASVIPLHEFTFEEVLSEQA